MLRRLGHGGDEHLPEMEQIPQNAPEYVEEVGTAGRRNEFMCYRNRAGDQQFILFLRTMIEEQQQFILVRKGDPTFKNINPPRTKTK